MVLMTDKHLFPSLGHLHFKQASWRVLALGERNVEWWPGQTVAFYLCTNHIIQVTTKCVYA